MKAKNIISLCIIFVLLVALSTTVFAEPIITVPDKSLKLNDEFEMGIDTGEPLKDVEFTMQYNKDIFEYVSSSTSNVDISVESGKLVIKPQNSTESKQYSVILKFKVINTSDKTENFILNCKGTNASGFTVNLTGVKGLNVVETTSTPTSTPTPTPTPVAPTVENKVEQMPSTGSLDYIIPGIVAVLLAGMFVIYRKNKNLY